MKKILLLLLLFVLLLYSFTTCVFASSVTLTPSYSTTNTLYNTNPYTSVVLGRGGVIETAVGMNITNLEPTQEVYPQDYSSVKAPQRFYSDYLAYYGVGFRGSINGDVTDKLTSYYDGNVVTKSLNYFSVSFGSGVHEYLTADYLGGENNNPFLIATLTDSDIDLSVSGDIVIFSASDDIHKPFDVYRIPITDIITSLKTLPSGFNMRSGNIHSVEVRKQFIADGYNNYYLRYFDFPHSAVIEYIENNIPQLDNRPKAFSYDDCTITLSSDEYFVISYPIRYSYDYEKYMGSNYITVEMMSGYDNETFNLGYNLEGAIEAIMASPFLLGITYINWLYICGGLILFRYLLKLFMGG